MAGGSSNPGRSVISKVSMILLALSEGSRTLTEIAAHSDLPLSTVHRLATDLLAWRVLERTGDGRYRAGPPLRAIGRTGSTVFDDLDNPVAGLRDRAVPVMEDLYRAVGVRVRVGFFDKTLQVAYVQKESPHKPVSRDCAAARLPAHASALGKVLLAFAPPPVVKKVLARRLRRYTASTVTSPEQVHAMLRSTRATRLGVCDGELECDSCAVAAPVVSGNGEVVAAIELHARDLATDVATLRAPLVVAAGSLSRELGRRPEFRPVHTWHHMINAPMLDQAWNQFVVSGS